MKKLAFMSLAALFAGFIVALFHSSAQEGASEEAVLEGLSGEAGIVFMALDGEDESAKFEEYRAFPDPVTGEVEVRYEKKDRYFLGVKATDIGLDDQYLNFVGGWYGKMKLDFTYDMIPHRYQYDALTLYSGVGSGNLRLNNALQADLQGSANAVDLANRLSHFFQGAVSEDIELSRDRMGVNFDAIAFDPINIRVEFNREKRDGTKPFAGSFGFANTVEIPEPIDYDTTELKLIGEYAKNPLYLNASYYFSLFKNDISTLTWDNPFRVNDSTNAGAFFQTFGGGASEGRITLPPDNQYHNVSLTGSLMTLPLRSRISASASWGWMRQDDDLSPYTTNSAIVPGAANNPPFDASDPHNLPTDDVDAQVNTSLYDVKLSSNPLDFLHVNGKFRYFEYDNETERIRFPGWVVTDATWMNGPIENVPTSYDKTTAGIDLGFDLFKRTRLTLGYTFEQTNRTHREVSRQDDHILSGAVDTSPLPWFDLRVSYERTERDIGDYDYLVALEGGGDGAPFPFLRKYDEADLVRDRFQLLATVYPLEPLTVSGSFIYGQDSFKDSPFGLLDDKHYVLSFDADYAVTDALNLYAFYIYEWYRNKQRDRQWVVGGTGDPYTGDTGYASDSNWFSESEDIVNTIGGGVRFAVIRDRLDFDLSYSFSDVDGDIDFSSPVGAVDANPFVPVGFITVDETRFHVLNAKITCRIWRGLALTLGYLWERFDYDDFEKKGFTNIPRDTNGGYNGALLMGTLPEDYDVNAVYTKISYKF